MPAVDRVHERRRAAALARHYRDEEGLSIAEIARRLGRAEATVKAYLCDPTGEKAPGGQGSLRRCVPGCGAYTQPATAWRRRPVLHGLPSRVDPGALDPRVRAGSEVPGGPAAGWLASTSAKAIRVRCRISTSGSLLQVVRTGSEVGVDEGGCSPTRAGARCACRLSRIRPAASTPATPEGSRCDRSRRRPSSAWRCAPLPTRRCVPTRASRPAFVFAQVCVTEVAYVAPSVWQRRQRYRRRPAGSFLVKQKPRVPARMIAFTGRELRAVGLARPL